MPPFGYVAAERALRLVPALLAIRGTFCRVYFVMRYWTAYDLLAYTSSHPPVQFSVEVRHVPAPCSSASHRLLGVFLLCLRRGRRSVPPSWRKADRAARRRHAWARNRQPWRGGLRTTTGRPSPSPGGRAASARSLHHFRLHAPALAGGG